MTNERSHPRYCRREAISPWRGSTRSNPGKGREGGNDTAGEGRRCRCPRGGSQRVGRTDGRRVTVRVPADLPVLEERPRRGEALEGHDRPAPAGGGTVAPAESLSPPPALGQDRGGTAVALRWRVGSGWTDGRSAPVPIPSAGQVSCECFQPPSPGPRRPTPTSVIPHFGKLPVRGGVLPHPLSAQSNLSQPPASPQREPRPARGRPRTLPRPIPLPPQPLGHPRDRKPCHSSLAKAGTSVAASSGVCCFTSVPARPPHS